MPTLTDLIRRHTALGVADHDWVHALVSDWQLLADLSFADLILWLPLRGGAGWVAGAQLRPTTGPTAFQDDFVGSVVRQGRRPLVDAAWAEGRICREGDPEWSSGVPVRDEAIPVRREGRPIGVIQRSTNLSSARTPSRLELTYLQCAADLAQMIADGEFPFPEASPDLNSSPRVGDGLVRLNSGGTVTYASPNAQSAYRRLGLTADLVGTQLGRTTAELCRSPKPVDEALAVVASGRAPRETEVEANGSVVQLRAIPLTPGGRRIGALILVHDVTELRRRDRELMTKDATIREIHHRVKNNLQTVAALLRLQARRISAPEGREALHEAVRRVGSIAIVHETLSHTLDENVDFDDIVDRVMGVAGELSAPDARVTPRRSGSFGVLPAAVATPLAMVLTELLQNALEHGLRDGSGTLEVDAHRDDSRLRISVADSGRGLPPDFQPDATTNLGLQIVRTLVIGELGGELHIGSRERGGVRVLLDLPLDRYGI